MELRKKKLNSITWKLIVGILIFLVVNTLILPDYNVWDASTNFILSCLSVFGWGLFIKAGYELYEDNQKNSVARFQIISSIGFVVYCVFFIFWLIAMICPTEKISDYIYATGGWHLKCHPGPDYIWCIELHNYVGNFIIVFRILFFALFIPSLNSAVCNDYRNLRRFNLAGIVNITWIVLIAIFSIKEPPYKLSTLRDGEIGFLVVLFVMYITFLVLYVLYIGKYLNISLERKNGSIFNRIPEEEYQEFLEKMK